MVEESGAQVHWFLTDHQGTVKDVVESTGVVIDHVTYDSFGRIVGQTSPIELRFAYTGREWDGETGQYYYRARYYDDAVGRFISEDPIGFDANDNNLSRYVGNSSINFIDPNGLQYDRIDWGGGYYRQRNAELQRAAAIRDEIKSYGDAWLTILPDCPYLEKNIKEKNNFYELKFNPTLFLFHPGAEKEYRSEPVSFYGSTGRGPRLISRPAQQCTYKGGKLIISGKGAGTPDFWTSKDFRHQEYDVFTFNNLPLNEYLSVWKPNQGDGNCTDKDKCNDK